jgi:hypothetical protein
MTVPSDKPANRPAFQQAQHAFASHIRDPKNQPAPADVEERRMAIYRDLFYNNVESFLANGFPVIRSLYSEADWQAMVRDFFVRHRAETPYFHQINQEFISYLQLERDVPDDPPFLLELAHYEWAELVLALSDDEIDMTGIDAKGDLYTGIPVLSPLAWPLSYHYAVHRIGPDFRPEAPDSELTHLVVYRNRDDVMGFLEINPVTARLVQLLADNDALTGEGAIAQIIEELRHPNPQVVIDGGLAALEELRGKDIILGTRQA